MTHIEFTAHDLHAQSVLRLDEQGLGVLVQVGGTHQGHVRVLQLAIFMKELFNERRDVGPVRHVHDHVIEFTRVRAVA